MKQKIVLFWFRRDLRMHDNHGLYQALKQKLPVLPIFIFDTSILGKLTSPGDIRVTFIYTRIQALNQELEKMGSALKVLHNNTESAFKELFKDYDVTSVYANKDYEPYARLRDEKVKDLVELNGAGFLLFKDHVIFEEDEILKENGKPYTVFTPYCRKWHKLFNLEQVVFFTSEKLKERFLKVSTFSIPSLKELGFERKVTEVPSAEIPEEVIKNYAHTRNFPAMVGTTRLGVHLRFGTVSIRELVLKAIEWSDIFLNELIWREFFIYILWHFPRVIQQSFKIRFESIQWLNNEKDFESWCKGETGYPMVDAGMRELNSTGFMHNRVRMITAGFLSKHLLIDWRWGEAYFAEKLLDYELASNNGNWQWAAGTGCDAAPWFRIFNPEIQKKNFDSKAGYIKKWVPEYGTSQYAKPIVEHKMARERALQVYKSALR